MQIFADKKPMQKNVLLAEIHCAGGSKCAAVIGGNGNCNVMTTWSVGVLSKKEIQAPKHG